MRNKRVLPALLGSVALTLGLVTVSTSINKEVVNAAEKYVKATSIAEGDEVVLVCETKKMELSSISTTSKKYGIGVAYTSSPVGAYPLDVVAGSSSGTFAFKNGANYLNWSSENTLAISTTLNANSSWKVTFNNNGTPTITNASDSTRKLQWNASSPRFACYTSAQTEIQLYKKENVEEVPLYANSQDIHDVMDDFYNEGTYTKKTEIFLNDAALTEIAEHFHGPVQQDRTTYYTTEDGKEALYMADLNGEISKINSGYSTVNESNIEAVRGKFSSVVEGNMAHFKYNKETEKAEYDYIVKTEDGIAGYYHALDEMFAQDYFGDTAWIDNEDGTFAHTVTGANDAYLEFFLAFAAPCLKPSILTDSNYITVDGMKLVIGTDKNDLNNKEYLSLKMVLVENETNIGLVDNTEMVLSEARIYAGNDMFDEKVKNVPANEVEFALGANGSASHSDGSNSSTTTYTSTVNDYTLSITNGTNMYTGARDAKGNSCIKFGSSSKAGSMQFTVPNDVKEVVIYVAKYKANTTKINVNGTAYTLTKNSNDGAYDAIKVDTSSTKTITFTTVSGGYRCMLNTIVFITQ